MAVVNAFKRVTVLGALSASLACTATIEQQTPGGGAAPGVSTGGSSTQPAGGSGSTPPPGAGGGSAAGAGMGSSGMAGAPPGTGGTGGVMAPLEPVNLGALVVRRLSRVEYDNTVRDLVGTSVRLPSDLADDLGAEFDTVGSALSLSPKYVRGYEETARAIMDDLFKGDPARLAAIVSCDVESAGASCADTVVRSFARRAFRRPVTDEEVQSLLTPLNVAATLGASPSDGLKSALTAVLMSPFFIFKLEIDPDPASTLPRRLTPHELATRLSYALWSTMPDEPLSAAADAGTLATDEEVGAQVQRMLADPRARTLTSEFVGQWLGYRELETHEVEPTAYPEFSPEIALSMKAEAQAFFNDFLSNGQPVGNMFQARFTFLDATLAEHYGIARPTSVPDGDFVRVDTSSVPRAGLLTLGAFLTKTSYPARTSPVRRGDYVFSRLLCEHVEPPPPGVEGLPPPNEGESMRALMERHRADPACAGCHAVMDPIGFGLENYDGVGAYRTTDNGAPVDATGILPDGTAFDGGLELSAILAADPRFQRCVTEKFMTFAIGRLLDRHSPLDASWIDYLSHEALARNGSFDGIIRTVVSSEAFRSRQPAPTL
jgi:hypothetical protein